MPEAKPSNPGQLLVLAGPSGVGKSTIALRLSEELPANYISSATTRPYRPEDDKGKRYEHIDQAEFFRRLDAGEFLEYAQVYANYYGTPKEPALSDLAAGKDVLLEIDVQGALQVKYQFPKALLIFILPPNEHTLLERLRNRGRDSDAEIAKRYRAARREIHMAKGSNAFDEMVVNDDLEKAVRDIVRIVKTRKEKGKAKL